MKIFFSSHINVLEIITLLLNLIQLISIFIFKHFADATDTAVLDLSRKGLKKIPKVEDSQSIKHLILDENDLQKIDNIDSYLRIEKVSLNLLGCCWI
jgi:hypothetical protein